MRPLSSRTPSRTLSRTPSSRTPSHARECAGRRAGLRAGLRLRQILVAPLTFGLLLLGASLAEAQGSDAKSRGWKWEGSRADKIVGVGFDALLIRPLATARVAIGAAFLIPAALFSAPGGGRDSVNEAYEFFVGDPAEYAFGRKLGEFES